LGNYRKQRFRKILLPLEELPLRASAWRDQLVPIQEAWRSGRLTDAEAAAHYLLGSLQFWFPKTWAGVRQVPCDLGVRDLVAQYSLKAVRLDARRALLRWLDGRVSLTLVDYIPEPREVLRAQVNGRRYVSALFKTSELGRLVHDGRDALSFILHDLGHAEKFFGGELETQAQIGCYRLFLRSLEAGQFTRLAEIDAEWNEKLHYMIADLNSHPAHILSVFWATAREVYRTGATELEFHSWRKQVYSVWEWSSDVRQANEELMARQNQEAAVFLCKVLSDAKV
jgi:hypothetical protein